VLHTYESPAGVCVFVVVFGAGKFCLVLMQKTYGARALLFFSGAGSAAGSVILLLQPAVIELLRVRRSRSPPPRFSDGSDAVRLQQNSSQS
jgi:hypothetical protein